MMSDGEWQEGSNWEALIFVNHHHLPVTIVVDANGLQGFGSTIEIASQSSLIHPFPSAWHPATVEVDGHNLESLAAALATGNDEPRAIIARTHKGNGVSFMEDRMEWHYLPLANDLYAQALKDLSPPMRTILCDTMVGLCNREDFVFLTGDLGYNALESLQAASARDRFINCCSVAEQKHDIRSRRSSSIRAASLEAYSIAPFIYARPFEQIRNDVCLHDLPVMLIGNGGGYGYGVMGGTHHAIEDYGALLCLQHMQAFVPAFGADVPAIVADMSELSHPAYLRLGRCEKPPGCILPDYAPWRHLISGGCATR